MIAEIYFSPMKQMKKNQKINIHNMKLQVYCSITNNDLLIPWMLNTNTAHRKRINIQLKLHQV